MIQYNLVSRDNDGDNWINLNTLNGFPPGLRADTASLVDYIDMMCIVNKGRSFSLRSSFAYNSCEYKESFFGGKFTLKTKKRIDPNRVDKHMSIRSFLPSGIVYKTELVEAPHTLTREQYKQKPSWHDTMIETYIISEEYSFQKYEIRNKVYNNSASIFPILAQDFNCTVTYFMGKPHRFNLTLDTISCPPSNSKYPLMNFEMEPFPNDFICFCFADSFAHYIAEQNEGRLYFNNLSVNWHLYSHYYIYGIDKTLVSIMFSCSPNTSNRSDLKAWV